MPRGFSIRFCFSRQQGHRVSKLKEKMVKTMFFLERNNFLYFFKKNIQFLFENVVPVDFQNVFHLEIYQNNIFYFLKSTH